MKKKGLVSTRIKGVSNPVYLRKDSTDLETLRYVFYNKEYRLEDLTFKPKWIIDGGAYAGYTSVYYANQYPEARTIAVEADPKNFTVLQKNTEPYPQVELLQSGLWHKDTFLKVRDVGLGEWGMMVEESEQSDPDAFKAVTVDSIMETYGIDEIDLLKLNIEGAEKELFTHGYEKWLDKVKILVIELHDRMKPGCSEAFFNAIQPYNFASFKRGYNHILYKEGCFR
ncbi:FkbM family methyltransferase [Alkalihalobacillus sp. AL-G]|uniref:FkbM family methyltransferase n=1 Tax=Alkalihalobacillus sp. AL-G TaxID=2926399 RepID=UPI00272A0352|nr:FkbM family methyltransferase [Alkalihalobacillus sp. AL-G]WLD93316.1 FkbM family methyltransferase [Alkalihalobacillus sp. AL-G]